MNGDCRVLLALADRSLALRIVSSFKGKFPNCPLHFDIVDDGHRAINEVRFFRHQAAMIDDQLPGISGKTLASELLKVYGECQVILLTPDTSQTSQYLTKIHLPILNWDAVVNELSFSLPVDYQIDHGLQDRNSQDLEHLREYAKKYDTGPSNISDRVYTSIQGYVTGQPNGPASNESDGPLAGKQGAPTQVTIEISARFIWSEVVIIGILAALLFLLHFQDEEQGILRLTMKSVVALALFFSSVGFFALRFIKKAR